MRLDFDAATLNGKQTTMSTTMYASSEFYADRKRYEIDDLESLVFSMWYVAGVPIGLPFINGEEPEGYVLCECKKMGKAEARMQVSKNNLRFKYICPFLSEWKLLIHNVVNFIQEKCNQIDNWIVRKAFQFVCINEILLTKTRIPEYDLIIEVLTGAIDVMNGNIEPTQFELKLDEAVKSSATSTLSRIFSIFHLKG